ncbi:hypothetical protein [Streptomonospora wellingtoniae]|uniref:Uncharacterized protein n=1 Tax=Streptomonospora wellingtoniae TaxID=3075544 RepID=A0ABU2KUY6_9ACTN|nr:hypothetical protein [Streptomonospora sp. DSM 45055]MDT0302938.1 hypothetical protein [Streptomonospora sp. DSM 45055]
MSAVAAELARLAAAANQHAWDYERTQAIGQALAHAGATGQPRNGCSCPLARHLSAISHQRVYVNAMEVIVDDTDEIDLTGDLRAISEFVRDIDAHPDRFAALRAA